MWRGQWTGKRSGSTGRDGVCRGVGETGVAGWAGGNPVSGETRAAGWASGNPFAPWGLEADEYSDDARVVEVPAR